MDVGPISAALFNELQTISRRFCLAEGGSHGPDHTQRVLHNALAIGREMDADLTVLVPAALLHDIGRNQERLSKGKICHALEGSRLARPLLFDLHYTSPQCDAICHCIESHRFRSGRRPASLEARILFDADKLDSIGAIGIGRAFLYAGQIGARLHNPEVDHRLSDSYSLEDTAYREFQVKMRLVHQQMLTPVGKRLADERHAFMELFFNQLTMEVQGGQARWSSESDRPNSATR
jgi:uncharacterized protein